MLELGRVYKDKITGFVGIATGYVQYLTGCNQALLAPGIGPDGALRSSEWFDEQRLTPEGDKPAIVLDNAKSPGPDRPAPKH